MLHLKDVEGLGNVVDPVAGPRSVAYGEGVVDVGEVLRTLRAARFEGLACVELGQLAPGDDELALVESCVSWLRTYTFSNA
jgi:sugar phosphate isomerase/epimerase